MLVQCAAVKKKTTISAPLGTFRRNNMPFSKADWVTTAITRVLSGIAYYIGGGTIAFLCICLGILIFLCVHILERRETETKVFCILGCIVFMLVVYFSVVRHSLFYKPPQSIEPITPENIQPRIMEWVRLRGQSASYDPVNKERINLTIYGDEIFIYRMHNYLRVQSSIPLTSTQQVLFAKISQDQQKELDRKLKLKVFELGVENFGFTDFPRDFAFYPYKELTIMETMKEDQFMDVVEQI
jgi:hypothetical protein